MDHVSSQAIRQIRGNKEANIPATLAKEYAETEAVHLFASHEDGKGPPTSLSIEKEKYVVLEYRMNRYRSLFENVKSAIMSGSTCLNYDRAEMVSEKGQ
jgi:hypothetical protein